MQDSLSVLDGFSELFLSVPTELQPCYGTCESHVDDSEADDDNHNFVY